MYAAFKVSKANKRQAIPSFLPASAINRQPSLQRLIDIPATSHQHCKMMAER